MLFCFLNQNIFVKVLQMFNSRKLDIAMEREWERERERERIEKF